MKFLIIIPVHNEEKNISFCLKSLEQQSFQNFEIVLVNDGSTDKSSEIIKNFVENASIDKKVKILNLPASAHSPGAKVVKTFNEGLQSVNSNSFDVICKFDADIIFPPEYLEEINNVYENNPKAGMVSGIVKIKKEVLDYQLAYDFKDVKKQWIFENISSKNHIRGPIKSYRRACFEEIGGLRPVLGWDNIDVMLAKMHGWEIITLKNLWVKHLRPTAYQYKKQKAEKLGEYFYNIGLNLPLAFISAAKAAWKSKSLGDFFTTMQSYFKQHHTLSLSDEEIRYIRKYRMQEMLRKIGMK